MLEYIRVNCGGIGYTNTAGAVFRRDQRFNGTNAWGYVGGDRGSALGDVAVAGTEDDPLYLTERWGLEEYHFRVKPGIYRIAFHFNEFFFGEVGRRVFDVCVNGKKVVPGLDIVRQAGATHALVVARTIMTDDGRIVISANEIMDRCKFSAIAIEPAETDEDSPMAPRSIRAYVRDKEAGIEWPAVEADDLRGYFVYRASSVTGEFTRLTTTPIDEPYYVDDGLSNEESYLYRVSAVDYFDNESHQSEWVEATPRARTAKDLSFGINIGGDKCRDTKGRTFIADRPYNAANGSGFQYMGKVLEAASKSVREPSRSLREGPLAYRLDLPEGIYRVALGFLDPWSREEKDRVFSIHMGSFLALADFDLLANYGWRYPVEIERVYRVREGEGLEISLEPRYGEPLLSFVYVEPFGPDDQAPVSPKIKNVVSRDGIVYLEWTRATASDVVGYQVLRAAEKPMAFRPLSSELVGANSFVDDTVENGGMYFYEVVAVDASGNESRASKQVRALPHFPDDDKLLEIISRAAFEYFAQECDPKTYLTKDKNVADVISVASTGFGLSALCVGVDRGWMPWEEGERRAYLMLRSLNYYPHNKVNGLFFHYLSGDGARSEKGYEDVVSTIDSALLMWGALAAGEYFGGRVKAEAELMMKEMNWRAYADDMRRLIMMAYKPNENRFEGTWDFYTDEALLVVLLGISAPNPEYRLSPDYFYSFKREVKSYKNIKDMVITWPGALFTYTFAHCWLDFQWIGPDNPEAVDMPPEMKVDWWENSVKAARANKEFCSFLATRHESFGENAWGLTACSGPGGRYTVCGSPPCGGAAEVGGGTLALYGAGMAVPFLPDDAMGALRYYYGYRNDEGEKVLWKDEFEGGYGLIDAFNADKDFYSEEIHGINHGPMLLLIENYRSGLIWKLILKNPAVRAGLERAGFVFPTQ